MLISQDQLKIHYDVLCKSCTMMASNSALFNFIFIKLNAADTQLCCHSMQYCKRAGVSFASIFMFGINSALRTECVCQKYSYYANIFMYFR